MPNVGANDSTLPPFSDQLAERGVGGNVVRIEREAEKGLLARRTVGVAVVARAHLTGR